MTDWGHSQRRSVIGPFTGSQAHIDTDQTTKDQKWPSLSHLHVNAVHRSFSLRLGLHDTHWSGPTLFLFFACIDGGIETVESTIVLA